MKDFKQIKAKCVSHVCNGHYCFDEDRKRGRMRCLAGNCPKLNKNKPLAAIVAVDGTKGRDREMSLQEDAKKLLPLIQAAAEGKGLRTKDHDCQVSSISGIMQGSYFFGTNSLEIIEPPKLRPWQSIEEMGEAVNDWFKLNNTNTHKVFAFNVSGKQIYFLSNNTGGVCKWDMESLLNHAEHTPTPWLSDSWKPCGIEEKDGGK